MQEAAWAKSYVEYLADKGIINGRSKDKFSPNDSILREEFVKVVLLAFDIQAENDGTGFTDVAEDEWYAKYISAAAAAGIVKGHGSAFGVGEKITRQDMAVMIQRALQAKNAALVGVKQPMRFADELSVREDAKSAIEALAKAGVIGGYEDNTFRPNGLATRGETAKMIYTALQSAGLIQ